MPWFVFYRLEEHLSHVHNYIFCAKSVGFGATYEHAVCTQMNSLLPWLNTCHCVPTTCLCACHCILNCVCVLKRRNTMWLGSITCTTSQIVWYNYKWGGFKEGKINAQCVCVPMPEWNCVCSCFLYVAALFWHVVVSLLENEDSK